MIKINVTFVSAMISLLFLAGACNVGLTGSSINENQDIFESNIKTDIFFCPRDDCRGVINGLVDDAKTSVHCAFFDLDLEDLIDRLAKKSHEADVKVIIDKNNYIEQITGPGVKIANSGQYMHNKFCIIDGNKVMAGSINPTNNGANYNNNNLIIINSKFIAENYEDEFNELWNGIYSDGDPVRYNMVITENATIENYFCPEDGCKDKIVSKLRGAEKSIYFMTYSFTDEDVADAILLQNVEIKGIFETFQAGSQYSQYKRMEGFGLDVKKDKNIKIMHHKVFIIDNETVITGSYNPTLSGNLRNDENILVIQNKVVAEKFLMEFEILWN
jgi:phosphatidylserine/phosphatidylglycerophosphate/cardiolipin synthase-like enzyme